MQRDISNFERTDKQQQYCHRFGNKAAFIIMILLKFVLYMRILNQNPLKQNKTKNKINNNANIGIFIICFYDFKRFGENCTVTTIRIERVNWKYIYGIGLKVGKCQGFMHVNCENRKIYFIKNSACCTGYNACMENQASAPGENYCKTNEDRKT